MKETITAKSLTKECGIMSKKVILVTFGPHRQFVGVYQTWNALVKEVSQTHKRWIIYPLNEDEPSKEITKKEAMKLVVLEDAEVWVIDKDQEPFGNGFQVRKIRVN